MADEPTNQPTSEPSPEPTPEPAPAEDLETILGSVTIDTPKEPTPAIDPAKASSTPAEPAATPNEPALDPTVYATREEVAKVNARLDEQDRIAAQEKVTADIKQAVDIVKQIAPDVPERLIKGDLYARADEDPRFEKAFQNRGQDPTTWNNVLRAIGENLASDASLQVDPQLRENQNALNAANANPPSAPTPEQDNSEWEKLQGGAFMDKFHQLANS